MPKIQYTQDIDVRNFGPLPILMPFLERLNLCELIDSLIPCTRHARISHGQVVCALVLNRLISPRAIYRLGEWGQHVAIPEALQIASDELNDDRILRTLDALFPQIEAIQGSLSWRVLERFQLDTTFIHWDLTSFFFEGHYETDQQDPQAPQVNYGSPKKQDAGKQRKQMQVGIATSEDGGIPFWHRSFSGNAAEISQVGDVMETLKRLVRHNHFTLIGDSKLISKKNILKALRLGISFLGPESRSDAIAEAYLKLRTTHRLQRLAYGSDKQPRKDRPYLYMGFETTVPITDEETGRTYTLRRLFIVSSEERRATRRNRSRKLQKLYEEIAKIRRNLGRYKTKTAQQTRERVTTLLEKTGMQDMFDWSVEGEGRAMTLHFTPNREAFRRVRQLDGVYTLITNLDPKYDIDQLLTRYKRQYLSEGRFRDLKGPLQLRPVFLKKNRRIVSLVFILYIALLVYCLIERTARKYLQQTGTTLPDVYTRRPLKMPTARRLLAAFEFYFVQLRHEGTILEYVAPEPNPLQKQILQALAIHQPLDFIS